MIEKKGEVDNIDYILNSSIGHALCQGFTVLFKQKPELPVRFLGNWLKNYSASEKHKHNLIDSKNSKQEKYQQMQHQKKKQLEQRLISEKKKIENKEKEEDQFNDMVTKTQYLQDLIKQWLPNYIQITNGLSGCYVGELTYRSKKLQDNNFQPGAELDTESPKVIEYIGASKSHQKLMINKILPNDSGRSYDVFNVAQQEVQEGEGDEKPKVEKKRYLYVSDVLKDEKIYYFNFPKLGCYACFPIRVKSCLLQNSFNKGLSDYKEYLKNKEEVEKEYLQKLNQTRTQMQELKKKAEQFEVNDEEGSKAEKQALEQAYKQSFTSFKQLESNRPVVPLVVFDSKERLFVLGCDTLGQDRKLSEEALVKIDQKTVFFQKKWQQKQYQMLQRDILIYNENESTLESGQAMYLESEKSAVESIQPSIKQQFATSEKQIEFQISVGKFDKVKFMLREQSIVKSMKVYLSYSVPKYSQILQIALMLLHYPKQQINLPNKNTINWRKVKEDHFIQSFINKFEEYELRRESSENVHVEYKISKLLQRMEKIDLDQVVRYNIWIWMVGQLIKLMCWARIQCRDVKLEQHQKKIKLKQERDAQIIKYDEDLMKALQGAKSALPEEAQQGFIQEQWKNTYIAENPKPEQLQLPQFKPHLDIQ